MASVRSHHLPSTRLAGQASTRVVNCCPGGLSVEQPLPAAPVGDRADAKLKSTAEVSRASEFEVSRQPKPKMLFTRNFDARN